MNYCVASTNTPDAAPLQVRQESSDSARAGAANGRGNQVRLSIRVWLRLLGCTNLVLANLRRQLRTRFHTTLPNFDILAQVHRSPRGPTMSELSRRLLVSKGNVTDLVARLERRGLLERRADERDARVQHVHLTRAGEKSIRKMLAAHALWLTTMTAGVGRQDLADLYLSLGKLKATLANADTPRQRRGRSPAETRNPRARAGARAPS